MLGLARAAPLGGSGAAAGETMATLPSDKPEEESPGTGDDVAASEDGSVSGRLSGRSGTRPRVDSDDPLPRMLGERYRLEALIAKGGMGRVYRAVQLPLERNVAIKLMVAPPNVGGDFARRFLLEASVSARLKHQNIVVVHDYGETENGELYMAMELLDGMNLSALLKREGPLDPLRVIRMSLQVARALRAAHREGIAHRDLKPGNVFVDQQMFDDEHEVDTVKVLDFGLVKVYEDGRQDVEKDLTDGGMMLGSPRYMSPEQILCERVDARSDIYSLGALMFAMLAGRPPFVGKVPMDVLTQHLQRPPPSISETLQERTNPPSWTIPQPLEAIVHRCLAKDAGDRFADIDEVIAQLKEVRRTFDGGTATGAFSTLSSESGISHTGPRPPLGRRSMPRWFPVVALLTAAVGATILALAGGDPEPEPEPTTDVAADPLPPPLPETAGEDTVEVTVTSDPPGAEVLSGGVFLGETPLTRSLRPTPEGARRVFEVRLEGYEPARVARAVEGESVEVSATLTPIPEPPAETDEPEETEASMRRVRRPRPRQVARPEPVMQAEPSPPPEKRTPPRRRSLSVDGDDRGGIPIVD